MKIKLTVAALLIVVLSVGMWSLGAPESQEIPEPAVARTLEATTTTEAPPPPTVAPTTALPTTAVPETLPPTTPAPTLPPTTIAPPPTPTTPVTEAPVSVASGSDPGVDAHLHRIAQCESGGDPGAVGGGGIFRGAFQFWHEGSGSTWLAYGGGQFASDPVLASYDQQLVVARAVYAGSGPGAWPHCQYR